MTEEIEALIREAVAPNFRNSLSERGLARSMIWQNGVLPVGSPSFAKSLSYDLLSYSFSLISLGLRLKELDGDKELYRHAFEKGASAITEVVQNGDPSNPDNGFYKVLASSAYHLGQFSAKAFSLISNNLQANTISPTEKILSLLLLRDFSAIETGILEWKLSGQGSDATLASLLESEIERLNSLPEELLQDSELETIELPVIDLALTDNYYSAIFKFLFCLETGQNHLLQEAIDRLDECITICNELNLVPQWWVFRITKHLISDLWESSFHRILPDNPLNENNESWRMMRWLFIASLFKRNIAEIDLWPSQIEGAKRAVNDHENLVLSLPTSAGKTRIAELCILRSLAVGKRVLFITPLRALSAQTESTLIRTFLPLGKSVSSLYGSIGTSNYEQDVLRTADIVVGTPEKLDFALRNDPSLIDDVGLVVLDEGHMIGPNTREISYEVQVQRLLKRGDAQERRIVCLSAILPSGEQFDDFVGWITQDNPNGAIQSEWRPTDLRFGQIEWSPLNKTGKLDFILGAEQAFIPNFIQSKSASNPNPGVRTTPFPKNAQELTLASAWRLIDDNHTVLIYCAQRNWVESFAKSIIDLYKRGALPSILEAPDNDLTLAKALGAEWLGLNHPVVECLNIGVAVHHGALPTPFRKEVERLLAKGVLKITVSSPTLAQGLNLSATAVIMYFLHRAGNLIEVSEFKNVIGRAGRAFIDTHGLVLHPIFDKHQWRSNQWKELIAESNSRNMKSGLVQLVLSLLNRIAEVAGTEISDVQEYVLNNLTVSQESWEVLPVADESLDKFEEAKQQWQINIGTLDTSLLSR